jgi:anaerobic ribonucleoside-triphosphate reductase
MHRSVRALILGLAATFVVALGAPPADAGRKPEDVFGGSIITSKKRFPTSAKSASQYISKLKKQRTNKFWEDKENQRWRIYFAAFFKKPLNDLEVTVKLYDITDGSQKLVASFEQYLDGRGQRSIISSIKLKRSEFGVNRHIMMVIENRGRRLALGKFKILGEAERYSGKVEFTEEEAAKGAKD